MIKIYEQTKAVKTLDSLASLSFIYKDWETSIDYAKKAIEVNPTAERYFILGGASGFRALEVPILSSLKFVNIMKPAFEQAVRLEPMNVKYLRAQVDVLLSLPMILGGSIYKARQHIKKIKSLNPVEGFLAEGSMHEINKDFDSAKHFFRPEWSHLYDPLLMQDMDAAMVKVYCSEMLNKVADDTVQIFGGMGLMEEMPIQRLWRDSRLERIWDGTSEIQRHIITRSILRPLGG